MKRFIPACVMMILLVLCFVGCDTFTLPEFTDISAIDEVDVGENNHFIRFSTDGGTPIPSQFADQLTSSPYTEKEGHLFEGWFTDAALTEPVEFPLAIVEDMTVYAKWLKVGETERLDNFSLKLDSEFKNIKRFELSVSDYELDRLEGLDLSLLVTVEYDVRYVKEYNVFWDIGYLGAPKYRVSFINSDFDVVVNTDTASNTELEHRRYTVTLTPEQIRQNDFYLIFITDTVQNTIYYENIVLSYEWK